MKIKSAILIHIIKITLISNLKKLSYTMKKVNAEFNTFIILRAGD